MSSLRIALCGAGGRMGSEIVAALEAEPDLTLARAIERPGHPLCGRKLGAVTVESRIEMPGACCDVVVDFSSAEATPELARQAAAAGVALVSGVTALGAAGEAALAQAAERIAVLHAPNMSLGVAVLERLLAKAARRLPPSYDVEILEMHHRRKQDAPSGTALRLAALIEAERAGLTRRHGRGPGSAPRRPGELGIHALRGGEVVGEHRVIFAGPGERLELVHRAESRSAFVAGVFAAVRFVRGREPGLYGMADVLRG